jgi:hypothetical protein
MFIRRTKTRQTTTGEAYFTHRLVRSERVGERVRQRTLLNLGRHFALAQEDWPLLCQRLEQLLDAQHALVEVECPAAVEREAERLAAQLLVRQAEPSASAPRAEQRRADVQSVDIDSIELLRPRSVGVEQVGLWAMAQVDFIELLWTSLSC